MLVFHFSFSLSISVFHNGRLLDYSIKLLDTLMSVKTARFKMKNFKKIFLGLEFIRQGVMKVN